MTCLSLVVINSPATPIEKLHYLKKSLKGEVEQVIRNSLTTDANNNETWKVLMDHYENPRLLVKSYIAHFLALPNLKSESATEMKKLYYCVNNTIGSLEGIEVRDKLHAQVVIMGPLMHNDDLYVQSQACSIRCLSAKRSSTS